MKSRFLNILAFILICTGAQAQPPETNYLGNVVVSEYIDDGSYGPYNIGFTFSYWGTNYTQFYINSNGQVLFGSGSLESAEAAIPDAAAPNNFIAAFWDDLVVDSYGKILYTTIGASPNRKLVVQFTNMGFYEYPSTLGTFQVILHETSNIIQLQYRLIVLPNSERCRGGSATIGLENASGTAGVQYAYQNPTALSSADAISFTPVAGPSYTINPAAVYDGVYLTVNLFLPEPGITNLIAPPQDAVIGSDYSFEWGASAYAASYKLYISTDPELIGATTYTAEANLSYDITGLTLDETYYWGVFASNATGITWCEIKKFTTSSTPPLVPVPQTIWTEQGEDKTIDLGYTGGGGNPKTAIITSLPDQGELYQYNAGSRGDPITDVSTSVTDAGMKVIYAATGTSGNGVGNFSFLVNESGVDSDEATITVNVSPPGVPNVIYVAKNTNVEIQFDIQMADPAVKYNQFTVTVNGSPATIISASLKTGDVYTIVLTLATPLTGTETVYVAYTQGDVRGATGGYLFSFTNTLVTLTAQTIDLTLDGNLKYRTNYITLPATSSGGLTVTYSSSNPAVASVTSNRLYLHTLGSFTLTGNQTGNGTYAPVRNVKPLTVIKGDQTITFAALPAKTYGAADYNLSATASSGLTVVSFAGDNPSVATVAGTLVHIVGAGSVIITASQAGNSLWNAAPDVQRTQTVNKATLTATADNKSRAYGEANPPFTISYSGFVNSEDISVIDVVPTATSTATPATDVGTVPITVSGGSDNNYSFSYVSGTLTIYKADQTITFDALPVKETGDPDFAPGATASSGLTVSYTSDNFSVATIVSEMIHIVDAGSANITASESGDANYNAAADVIQPLTVDIATGLENTLGSKNSFTLYSAYGQINIKTLADEWDRETGSVRVMNIIGKPVNELRNIEFTKNSLVQLQAPNLNGLYIVEIRSGLKRYVGKIIIK